MHNLPILPARPRLAFAETSAHAERVLAEWSALQIDAVVALAPEAAWTLQQVGKPHLALEDGYDPARICALADPIVRQQQAWADAVDDWLAARLPAFRGQNFRPTRLHLYWLKIAFDSVAICVYPIWWALDRWQPSWVWYPDLVPTHAGFGPDLMFRESLYPSVLGGVARRLGVEMSMPEGTRSSNRASSSSTPREALTETARQGVRAGRRLLRAFRRDLARRGQPGQGAPLVLSDGYDLGPVCRQAASAGIPVVSWDDLVADARRAAVTAPFDEVASGMRDCWTAAVEQVGLLDPGIIDGVDGIDLRDLIESRVKFWWEVLVPEQWRAFAAVRQLDLARRACAVAVAGLGDHVERGAFAALRSTGVRTFMYQHGGFVGACECPPWDCNDLWLADYEFTYGSGTTAYFAERGKQYAGEHATPVTVGSSRLDSWQLGIPRGKPTANPPRVLLIPNLIPRNNRYFDAGSTPDVLESELQIALVEAARDFPQYTFTFKAFPNADQRRTPAVALARMRGSNCRAVTARSMRPLLARADFIVLAFASTALLEALLTDRRILVLVDPRFVRMRPEARRRLEGRASVASSPAEFVASYRRTLTEGDFRPLPDPDDTFLREYGTHLNDGRSAERALSAIRAPLVPSHSVEKCLA
jgi:hypothetical protein